MIIEKNTVVLGDCLEGLKQIPDDTFDIAVTSPPYAHKGSEEIDNYAGGTHRPYICKETILKEEWLDWQINIIDNLLRTCKKYVVYNVGDNSENRDNVYRLMGHYADKIHDDIIWYKPNGIPCYNEGSIANTYEHVLIIKKTPKTKVKVHSRDFRNVISGIGVNSNNQYAAIHHAVMNEKLSDLLIYEFTEKGDFVIDPFMGLGTTGVSCVKFDRYYFGFEIFELYHHECVKRLEKTQRERGRQLF